MVVDHQQAGPSRPINFKLTSTKHCNPLSVASTTGKVNSHNISGLSSFFGDLQSLLSYQQIDTPQPFSPSNLHQHTASPPTTQHQEFPQKPAQLQLPNSHPSPSSSRPTALAYNWSFSGQLIIHRSFSGPPKSSKNIL